MVFFVILLVFVFLKEGLSLDHWWNQMSDITKYTLAHHERWDGKGYPNGIKDEEISLMLRIISVADAYDAMTSQRTYKKVISG